MVHRTGFTTPCNTLCQKRKFPWGIRCRLYAWGPCAPEDESHLESPPPPPRINLTLFPYVFQTTKEHPSEKLNGKGEKWEWGGNDNIPIGHLRKLSLVMLSNLSNVTGLGWGSILNLVNSQVWAARLHSTCWPCGPGKQCNFALRSRGQKEHC